MNRRLRKKLRVGEFRECGFEVTFRLSDRTDDATVDAFWGEFIEGAIESAGLVCGGGCGRVWDVFVSRPGRRSETDQDRRAATRGMPREMRNLAASLVGVGALPR